MVLRSSFVAELAHGSILLRLPFSWGAIETPSLGTDSVAARARCKCDSHAGTRDADLATRVGHEWDRKPVEWDEWGRGVPLQAPSDRDSYAPGSPARSAARLPP